MPSKAQDVVDALYVPKIGDRVEFYMNRSDRWRFRGIVVATVGDTVRIQEELQGWWYECSDSTRWFHLVD